MNKGQRENTSLRTTQGIVNNQNSFGLKKFGDEGFFRSSYEHAFAVYLNELGIKYEFEKHGEPITNITNTQLHYIPDFYLPEYNIYIEIVNSMNKRLANKMYLFNQQNSEIKLYVFDKQHLRKMFDSKFTLYDIIGKIKPTKKRFKGGKTVRGL